MVVGYQVVGVPRILYTQSIGGHYVGLGDEKFRPFGVGVRLVECDPPHPPNNTYSPNMVYYNILGIFKITGVGGFIIRGGD